MKKFIMNDSVLSSWSKRSAAIGSMLALAFFAACGDDVTDNDPVTTQAYENEEALPKCDADYEGYFATLLSSQDVYICTAKNWVNISKAGSNAGASSKTSCTAEELSDGTGVEITCNGKKSVLQYGKQGAQGDPGKAGSNAENGKAGEPGGKGKEGEAAKPDADRCFVKYETGDVVLFECGDSTYVRNMGGYRAIPTDSPFDMFGNGSYSDSWYKAPNTVFVNEFGSKATGSLTRYPGDGSWTSGASMTEKDLYTNLGIGGTATVEVSDTLEVTGDAYRPFVGIRMADGRSYVNMDLQNSGFCITYRSDSAMALLLHGKTGYLRAELPAAKDSDAVREVLMEDFEPVSDSVDRKLLLLKVDTIYIEAVGGEAVGTYSNKFVVYQFGNMGTCDGYTINSYKAYLESIKEEGTLVDSRSNPSITYKTIRIGDQVWMAENLRIPYDYLSAERDEDPDVTTGEKMSLCPTVDSVRVRQGCTYTWAAAMDSAAQLSGKTSTDPGYNVCGKGVNCTAEAPVQGICPNGWHLPSLNEWGKLVSVLQNGNTSSSRRKLLDRLALVAPDDTYYLDGQDLSEMNMWFGANDVLYHTSFSSSTTNTRLFEFYNGYVYNAGGYPVTEENYTGWTANKSNKYPVRCVKDAE